MSKNNFNMAISPNGELSFIYDDMHAGFLEKLGVSVGDVVSRASHVEPCEGGWQADMSPIEPGVILGPFKLRQTALDEETAWLNKRLFGG
jgi:hypothetical protein